MSEDRKNLCADVKELQKHVASSIEPRFYSKNGVQINVQWWVMLSQDHQYYKIKSDEIDRFITVQTIWKGLDNREIKQGPPMLFETKVEFENETWVWNSPNLDMAGIIHAIVLEQLKQGIAPANIVVENLLN